jgi:AI-2 transport protein TqsA
VTSGPTSAPLDGAGVRDAAVPEQQHGPSPGASSQAPVRTAHPRGERPVLPRGLVIALGAASAVLILAGIRSVAWLVGPIFLALMIVIAIAPVQNALLRRGWPAWLSTLVLVVLVTGVLVVFALVIVISIARLAALVPQYADQAAKTLQSIESSLQSFGVAPGQLKTAVSSVDPAKLVALIGAVLAGLSGLATSLVFLLCLMLFLSVEAGGVDQRLAAVAADRPQLETALRSFAKGTRSYLVVTAVFGLIVGVLDGAALWIIGVPLPVLWGILSFLTNFIPNVGFIIGVIPPALIALLDGGLGLMVTVIVVYCVINFVIQSVLQPKFVSDAVDLSLTLTFLSLVFWSFVIGPLGAILAIPLTLLAKALLLDVDPQTRWMSALLAGGRAEPDEESPPGGERAAIPGPAGADGILSVAEPEPVPAADPRSRASEPDDPNRGARA